jgi:hypothetical protein
MCSKVVFTDKTSVVINNGVLFPAGFLLLVRCINSVLMRMAFGSLIVCSENTGQVPTHVVCITLLLGCWVAMRASVVVRPVLGSDDYVCSLISLCYR